VTDDAGGHSGGVADEVTGASADATSEEGFDLGPAAGVVTLYVVTILAGLALSEPFRAADLVAFEDPSSLGNVGLIVAEVLVFTAVLLVAFRYDLGEQLARVAVVGGVAYFLWLPLSAFLSGPAGSALAVGLALSVAVVLWVYPEWYVIDLAAVAFGGAGVALFGVSLSPLPVLALLVAMAAYDAYSVYGSEHMQSLGSGVVDLKLPMVFVVPGDREFSLLAVEDMDELAAGATLLGLGDALFPGLLAVSAATFLDAPAAVAGLNAPALGALAGAVVGILALQYLLYRVRRVHAGLPVLNGATIGGYLLGAVAGGVPLATTLGL
jgi:presenilin-like A22 family membrane protease